MPQVTRRDLVIAAAGAAIAAGLAPGRTLAQAFPARPIRLVVPYPPGGPTDALARIIAGELQAANGWTIVVENKPGASGAVGTRDIAKAEADGHALVLGNNQTHATNAVLMKDAGYDPLADFAPIAGLADLQHALVVRKTLAAATVAELVALAKQEPGKLNYGSTGSGSGSHLAMELFKTKTGTVMQHVPFRGAAPMALEIVAGRIDLAFATLPSVLGQIQSGDVRALAIASDVKAPQVPEVPLLKSQGVIGGEADSWLALFAPAKTPQAVRETLSKAVLAALAKPDVAANANKQGIAVNVRAPAAFRAYQEAELKKWTEVVRIAGVQAQ
jgi:tripartite-type tricarboxylate transporter receptor subunit TctC